MAWCQVALHVERDKAVRIVRLHEAQTLATAEELQLRWSNRTLLGRVPLWELIQRLSLTVDHSDVMLRTTNQWTHTLQVYEGMVLDGITVLLPTLYDPSELRSDVTGKLVRYGRGRCRGQGWRALCRGGGDEDDHHAQGDRLGHGEARAAARLDDPPTQFSRSTIAYS